MLSKIGLKNFKCFKDTGLIDIKPITLLFGKNGSGKTSFLDALYLMKQTVEDPDRSAPIVANGNLFEFGHYKDYVWNHEIDRPIELSFCIIEGSDLEIWLTLELIYNAAAERIQVRRVRIARKGHCIGDVQYDSDRTVVRFTTDIKPKREANEARGYFRYDNFYKFLPGFYPVFDAKKKSPPGAWFVALSVSGQSIISTFQNIQCMGPLREDPKRIYVLGEGKSKEVGYKGGRTLPIMQGDDSLAMQVGQWLEQAQLAKGVGFVTEGNTHFRPRIRGVHEEDDDIPDTGIGISQALPVAALLLRAETGSIVCLEQPELHLHPFAATRIADLLVKAAERVVTSIVETHSEHLLIRMQRLVAEGRIEPDKVAIYFFDKGHEGASLRPMSIRSDGALEKAPEGFFSEDYQELVEMQKSVAKGNRHS